MGPGKARAPELAPARGCEHQAPWGGREEDFNSPRAFPDPAMPGGTRAGGMTGPMAWGIRPWPRSAWRSGKPTVAPFSELCPGAAGRNQTGPCPAAGGCDASPGTDPPFQGSVHSAGDVPGGAGSWSDTATWLAHMHPSLSRARTSAGDFTGGRWGLAGQEKTPFLPEHSPDGSKILRFRVNTEPRAISSVLHQQLFPCPHCRRTPSALSWAPETPKPELPAEGLEGATQAEPADTSMIRRAGKSFVDTTDFRRGEQSALQPRARGRRKGTSNPSHALRPLAHPLHKARCGDDDPGCASSPPAAHGGRPVRCTGSPARVYRQPEQLHAEHLQRSGAAAPSHLGSQVWRRPVEGNLLRNLCRQPQRSLNPSHL